MARWDLHHYMAMAEASPGFGTSVPQPFVFRLLGPYIAGILPLHTPTAFYAITLVASLSLALLFYFFLNSHGINATVSVISVILFLLNKYAFGFPAWNYFQVNDILSLIEIILLYWAMRSSRWLLFSMFLMLGVLTRETALLMIPLAFVHLLESKTWTKAGRKYLVALIPGIMIFILIRLLVPHSGGDSLWRAFLAHAAKGTSPHRLYALLINSFAPLSLIPLVFLRGSIRFFRTHKTALLFLLLVFASTLFGSNDERLMAPAAPVFYLLIAELIETYCYSSKALLIIIAISVFLTAFDHAIGIPALPSLAATQAVSVSAMLLLTLALLGRMIVIRHAAN